MNERFFVHCLSLFVGLTVRSSCRIKMIRPSASEVITTMPLLILFAGSVSFSLLAIMHQQFEYVWGSLILCMLGVVTYVLAAIRHLCTLPEYGTTSVSRVVIPPPTVQVEAVTDGVGAVSISGRAASAPNMYTVSSLSRPDT